MRPELNWDDLEQDEADLSQRRGRLLVEGIAVFQGFGFFALHYFASGVSALVFMVFGAVLGVTGLINLFAWDQTIDMIGGSTQIWLLIYFVGWSIATNGWARVDLPIRAVQALGIFGLIRLVDPMPRYWHHGGAPASEIEDLTREAKLLVGRRARDRGDLIEFTTYSWTSPPARWIGRLDEHGAVFVESQGKLVIPVRKAGLNIIPLEPHRQFGFNHYGDPARFELGLWRMEGRMKPEFFERFRAWKHSGFDPLASPPPNVPAETAHSLQR